MFHPATEEENRRNKVNISAATTIRLIMMMTAVMMSVMTASLRDIIH
jgi:hypothetical protein